MNIYEIYTTPKSCAYLPRQESCFRYFKIEGCRDEFYTGLLERGWRRFGEYFFIPVCKTCESCISIRIIASDFTPSKNYKRVLKNTCKVRMKVQKPNVTQAHLDLYDKYHRHMHIKKDWEYHGINAKSYKEIFVDGAQDFGFEILYFLESRLIGVGLVDVLKNAISANYFYYDNDFDKLSLGTFNILVQLQMAKDLELEYFYPGYWIYDHTSMGYKARFKPYEYLNNNPDIFQTPDWRIYNEDSIEQIQERIPIYENKKFPLFE